MGLISWLEKLINEHGSATIMKERLALKDDQIALKEKKIAALESQLNEINRKDLPEQSAGQLKAVKDSEEAREALRKALNPGPFGCSPNGIAITQHDKHTDNK